MSLKTNQTLDLKRVIETISRLEGVAGILLFGSAARGDYDEYSDYDLLVLFEEKSSMWKSWDDLFKATSSLDMRLHVIPETLEEFKTANPVFLEELSKHGKVLFARFPMEVSLKHVTLKPYTLIFYSMTGLSYRDKMKASYFLYRKGGMGAVGKAGGAKLNEGCILVPESAAEEITAFLSRLSVKFRRLEVKVSEESLKTLSTHNQERPRRAANS
ncbi:MAG: nucleotidyltransferase domain-containing protein [Candidatus Bathyarchaeia archaeon]